MRYPTETCGSRHAGSDAVPSIGYPAVHVRGLARSTVRTVAFLVQRAGHPPHPGFAYVADIPVMTAGDARPTERPQANPGNRRTPPVADWNPTFFRPSCQHFLQERVLTHTKSTHTLSIVRCVHDTCCRRSTSKSKQVGRIR